MIIRILSEGQYDVPDAEVDALNELDEKLEASVQRGETEQFTAALGALLDKVRSVGTPVPLDEFIESDLLLPFSDASIEEVQDLLGDEGLIPGRTTTAEATEV